MEKPARTGPIIAPGRVYRRDAGCHPLPLFYQIEGLAVDEGITFGDLKGILTVFARKIFGSDREVRFRPSFFPFTEPSAEVDVSCGCQGAGCRICKNTGWLEILGAGSVDPRSWPWCHDPEKYSGFAFGMGWSGSPCCVMIPDIRYFYENDHRFWRSFSVSQYSFSRFWHCFSLCFSVCRQMSFDKEAGEDARSL